jgi:hypothetical protein
MQRFFRGFPATLTTPLRRRWADRGDRNTGDPVGLKFFTRRICQPSIKVLERIARALGADVADLARRK